MKIRIDNREYSISDPVLNGQQVLEIAGKRPPDDFIVYWLGKDNVLQDLGLEGTVHIHDQQVTEFLTFQSDRSYRFEIDGKREDWGASCITEETVRKLSGAEADSEIWLERRDQPDRLVKPGERVDLSEDGIEKFYVRRSLTIKVINEDNGEEFELRGESKTKLSELFERMYERLRVARQGDDRLRCDEGGGDVFRFGDLSLGDYVKAGHCKCLVWLFAGGTGGAV